MDNQQKQVIHLYEFEQESINEKELSKQILECLKPYLGEKTPQIKVKGKPHKYSAYFQIESEIAAKLNELKTVKVGDSTVHIGRYYHDYQIFINKLDNAVSRPQVIQYFEQFGEVVDIIITEPADKKNGDFKHCYIKMKDEKTIDRIVLARVHKIQDKQVKPVRTFGLEEDKESEKKLFLKIQGQLDSLEDFQQNAIEFFMKHGKIRERPRLQGSGNLKYKMIVTYTSSKDANSALSAFSTSSFLEDYKKKNVSLILNYFLTKENKIYMAGLKQANQAALKQAFGVFGKISDISLNKTKVGNSITAVIGFENENDFKMALATYYENPKIKSLFVNQKPYVTIFMSNEQKKSFQEMKKKQTHSQNMQVRNNNLPYMSMYPTDQMMMNRQMAMMPPNQNMSPNINPNMMPNMGPNMMPGMGPNMMPGIGANMGGNFGVPQHNPNMMINRGMQPPKTGIPSSRTN